MNLPALELDPKDAVPAVIGAVRDYWASKCRGARLPSREQIRPAEIKAWLPHILLVDVLEGGADFRYRVVGTRIMQDFTTSPTGRRMSDVIAPFGAPAVNETLRVYRGVVEGRAPLQMRGSGAWYAQGAKTFDAVLAPLSDDGERVNMIFGAFVFVFEEKRDPALQGSLLAAR